MNRLAAILIALSACAVEPGDPETLPARGVDSSTACEEIQITSCPGDEARVCESSCSCAEEGPNGEASSGDCACVIQCFCVAE